MLLRQGVPAAGLAGLGLGRGFAGGWLGHACASAGRSASCRGANYCCRSKASDEDSDTFPKEIQRFRGLGGQKVCFS